MLKWVTRQFVHVDRTACPWLIMRFVDPKAEFLFVPAEKIGDVVKRERRYPMMLRVLNSVIIAKCVASML